jgi:hypothetical protein
MLRVVVSNSLRVSNGLQAREVENRLSGGAMLGA